jgi:hypothetical protein
VITADSDFPTMLALRSVDRPSVVLLRHISELPRAEHARLLTANLPLVVEDLEGGAIVSEPNQTGGTQPADRVSSSRRSVATFFTGSRRRLRRRARGCGRRWRAVLARGAKSRDWYRGALAPWTPEAPHRATADVGRWSQSGNSPHQRPEVAETSRSGEQRLRRSTTCVNAR